jgi:hypothetical protein
MSDTLSECLALLDKRIANLQAELTSLQRAREILQQQLPQGVGFSLDPFSVQRMTRHAQAYYALQQLGSPATVPAIMDFLVTAGVTYDKRQLFSNSLYTAMMRHPEMFYKLPKHEWAIRPEEFQP